MASSGRGIAAAAPLAVLVLLLLQVYGSSAVVYNVGDRAAWTLSFNYGQWARRHSFRVNDVLRFTYTPVHNVMLVSRPDYLSCSSSNPLAVYSNGNTLVKLPRKGSYYFICGVAGHCESGMKMQVNVS